MPFWEVCTLLVAFELQESDSKSFYFYLNDSKNNGTFNYYKLGIHKKPVLF